MQRRSFDFGPEDQRPTLLVRLARYVRAAIERAWQRRWVRFAIIAGAVLFSVLLVSSVALWVLTNGGSASDRSDVGEENTDERRELQVRSIDNRADLINRYIAYTEDPQHTLFVGIRNSRQLATSTIDISKQQVGSGRYELHPYRTNAGTLYVGNRTDVTIQDDNFHTTPNGTVLAYVIDKRERTHRHLLYHIYPADREIELVYEQSLLGTLRQQAYQQFLFSDDGSRIAFHGITSDRTPHLKLLSLEERSMLGAYTGDELGLFRSARDVVPMRFVADGQGLLFRLQTSSDRQLSPLYRLSIGTGEVQTITDQTIVRADNWIFNEPRQTMLVAHPGPDAIQRCTGYTDRERVNNHLTLLSVDRASSTVVHRATSTQYLTDLTWQQNGRAAAIREGVANVVELTGQLGDEPFRCWQELSTSTNRRIIELPVW